MENDLSKVNQSETESQSPYQDAVITTTLADVRKSGGDVKVEDYPDEDVFVYKSQRKNLNLIRPPKFDALKLVSVKILTIFCFKFILYISIDD